LIDLQPVTSGAHGFTLFPNDLSKATAKMDAFLNGVRGLTTRKIRNKIILILSDAR
jgi:hypothetical protein